jgi:hypothetical protein
MARDDAADTRRAFDLAVDGLLTTAARICGDQWDLPATDAWTVHQLFAHTVRGMAVISDLLDAGGEPAPVLLPDAAAYFRAAFALPGIHEGIVERAVQAAATAGPDPLAWARSVADAARRRVADTPDDTVVVHFAGSLRFDDYLGTRVTELVLHTLDLQLACGWDPDVAAGAVAVVDRVLLDLADRADPVGLALALSGRPPARRCDVLG